MPVVRFGNTLTTSTSEDASREDGASLFFSVSFRGLDLGFCCVSSVQLGRGLFLFVASTMVVWPLWLRVVSTSVVVFLYRSSLPRSPKRSLYLLDVPGLRVLSPLLAPLFTQISQLCPLKFGVRNTWRGFSYSLRESLR